MEAQPESPGAPRAADMAVASNKNRVYTFHPLTAHAEAWLLRNVPAEYHANGHVVTGPLKAAQLTLWMSLEGIVVE